MTAACRVPAAMLFTVGITWSADVALVQVRVDTSKTPKAAAYSGPTTDLVREWYPKINAILFGNDYPLRFKEIKVLFAPKLRLKLDSHKTEVPAYAEGNTIHVNFGYLTHMPDDYRGMLIHELTHINQQYDNAPSGAGWLVEGIADYIRHKYYEKDIEAKLRIDGDGYLKGYAPSAPFLFNLEKRRARLDDKGYFTSYTVASAFLFWLEERKDKEIVRVMNVALSEGRYSEELFRQRCGAPLDALWKEFLLQSRPQSLQAVGRRTRNRSQAGLGKHISYRLLT